MVNKRGRYRAVENRFFSLARYEREVLYQDRSPFQR
jgi:hypothetical protein